MVSLTVTTKFSMGPGSQIVCVQKTSQAKMTRVIWVRGGRSLPLTMPTLFCISWSLEQATIIQ